MEGKKKMCRKVVLFHGGMFEIGKYLPMNEDMIRVPILDFSRIEPAGFVSKLKRWDQKGERNLFLLLDQTSSKEKIGRLHSIVEAVVEAQYRCAGFCISERHVDRYDPGSDGDPFIAKCFSEICDSHKFSGKTNIIGRDISKRLVIAPYFSNNAENGALELSSQYLTGKDVEELKKLYEGTLPELIVKGSEEALKLFKETQKIKV